MSFQAQFLPWTKVRELAGRGAVALLPLGSTEAHGPHLPLNVDVLIAREVCRRMAQTLLGEGTPALVFPALSYGVTDFAATFSGTVSVSAAATTAYLKDVVVSIARHGFQRIAVVNHHLEPAHFAVVHAACAQAQAETGVRVRVPDHRKKPTSPLLGEEFTHGGSHAGFYETSLMLAIAPHLVDTRTLETLPELAVDLPQKIREGARNFNECGGLDAYLGNPQKATAEEGERLLKVLVEYSLSCLEA